MTPSLSKYCLLVALLFFTTKAFNQACTFKSPLVQVISSKDSAGYCVQVVSLTVDINVNNGNKWTYIHLWTSNNYHTQDPAFNYSKAPTDADILGNDILTLALTYPSGVPPSLSSNYAPDPTENPKVQSGATGVTFTTAPSVSSPGATTFTFNNVRIVTFGACNPSTLYKGDSWSSQSANGSTVQCTLMGFVFATSDPTVQGIINCGTPANILNFNVTANGTGNQISFQFDVYADTSINNTTAFNPSRNAKIYTGSTTYNISNPAAAGSPQVLYFTSSPTPPPGYISIPAIYPAPYSTVTSQAGSQPNTVVGRVNNIYVVIRNIVIVNGSTTTNVSNGLVSFVDHTCTQSLSAKFGDINAGFKNGRLVVNWQTLQETNVKKYLVEASADGVKWTTIGELSSKSADGNSNDLLNYEFTGTIPAAFAGLVISILLIPVFRSRISRVIMIVLFLGFLGACVKGYKGVNTNDVKNLYIRITQIDTDNSIGTVSKVIKVIQ